ncbi:putative membrane protein [Halolamina pelagica]|uniref:Putative membrane protein n=1 Tax=Halolamina pelagica TaxID=699431 RepID=A0A0P7I053_9EURY|nr:flippase activity-associated protein Agl23 [Halolamina pelagica]KPN30033.1 putative membrane protein [Halolamina pelagica]
MFRPARWARRRPVVAVLALTALALLLRLVALGDRTVHWDEARVAYWTLRYVRGAGFAYRPIIHGPFVPIVAGALFERLGPTAFVARLPVAVIGGLAPLSALLFRRPGESAGPATDRLPRLGLSDAETVALAALLAGTPTLVYYSRFMRSDVPLAVFALFALGCTVRALATGRRRHVVAAGLFAGLAVPTKENVVLYAACAVGTAAVAVGWPAVGSLLPWRESAADPPPETALRDSLVRARAVAARHLPAVPLALLVALVPIVFFLAPRGPAGDPSLGAALAGDAGWLGLIERATLGTWETFRSSLWTGSRSHSYPEYAGKLWGYLLVGALPVAVGAGAAFVRELRSPSRPIVVPLVAWGVASMLGYPLATDIPAPWISIHLLMPLLVPAAVGWVALARGRAWEFTVDGPADGAADRLPDADARKRYARYALAALVVLSAVQVPLVLAATSITPPLYVNVLAQSAQPPDDLSPVQATVADAADDGGVLFYGEEYYLPNESVDRTPPADGENWLGWWLNRLPMAWYAEQADAPTAYARGADALSERASIPPVVFADPSEADSAAAVLTDRGYQRTRYDLGLYHEQAVVTFVDESRLDRGRTNRSAHGWPIVGVRRA